jgi:hypothetical protein
MTILKHNDNNEKIENDIVEDFEREKMSLYKGRWRLPTGGFGSHAAKWAKMSIWKTNYF